MTKITAYHGIIPERFELLKKVESLLDGKSKIHFSIEYAIVEVQANLGAERRIKYLRTSRLSLGGEVVREIGLWKRILKDLARLNFLANPNSFFRLQNCASFDSRS